VIKKTHIEEEKKEEVKKEVQAESQTEPFLEPNQEFLNELLNMGFPVEQAKKALTKTKNESLTAAIDSIVQS